LHRHSVQSRGEHPALVRSYRRLMSTTHAVLRDAATMIRRMGQRVRTVTLECVINTSGEVTEVKILRSLDQMFGLDQEAIKAAKQWRFAPGTRLGQPVPVLVSIELSFTLR
jgi:TonB family protein